MLSQIFKVVTLPSRPLPSIPYPLLHVRVRTLHRMNAPHQVHPVLPLIVWRRITRRPPSCARLTDFNLVHGHCLSSHPFFLLLTPESLFNGILWTLQKSMRIPSRTARSLSNNPCSRTQVKHLGAVPWTHLPVVIAPKVPHQQMKLIITIFIIRHVHPHNSPLRLPEAQVLATEAHRLGVTHRLNGMSCHLPPLHRTTLKLRLDWCQDRRPTQLSSLKLSHPP